MEDRSSGWRYGASFLALAILLLSPACGSGGQVTGANARFGRS